MISGKSTPGVNRKSHLSWTHTHTYIAHYIKILIPTDNDMRLTEDSSCWSCLRLSLVINNKFNWFLLELVSVKSIKQAFFLINYINFKMIIFFLYFYYHAKIDDKNTWKNRRFNKSIWVKEKNLPCRQKLKNNSQSGQLKLHKK